LHRVACIFVENDDAMSDLEKIQLFENKKILTVWVEKEENGILPLKM
jgi:hypothetical protein